MPHGHPEAIALTTADFAVGGPLPDDSYVLPHRLVTANESVIRRTVGVVSPTQPSCDICVAKRQACMAFCNLPSPRGGGGRRCCWLTDFGHTAQPTSPAVLFAADRAAAVDRAGEKYPFNIP